MSALVECIPNFSEGRRPDVIAQIVGALHAAAPIQLLDVSSDADHNRTVVSFAGTPAAVERAAFAAIRAAAALIDMDVQRGQHPRLGAADVVPFVPLRAVTLAECVGLARRLGARVGADLQIPVYLYAAAATRADRRNLEDIRRGQYEALKTAIGTDPARKPDFGPAALGKAGAVVIGARQPLIAFNVTLTTADVAIAQKIAKAVRFSNGGLRYVKAIGVLVEGQAQVALNLTHVEQTPIARVVELIRREAARYGVTIAFSELIGLAPEDALIDAARWYMQLDTFEPSQLLERQLAATSIESASASELADFAAQVAAGTPAPGGGAVAAAVGGLAAALAEMVANLSVGRPKYADAEPTLRETAQTAAELRAQLIAASAADGAAYSAVMAARQRDKTDPGRAAALQSALLGATQAPLAVLRLVHRTIGLVQQVAVLGNVNAIGEAGVAAYMAQAAAESAALTVRINAHSLADPGVAAELCRQAADVLATIHAANAELQKNLEVRMGLK